MRMKRHIFALAISGILIATGCENKNWDEYYRTVPETVDRNVWEAIQEDENLSMFTGYIKEFGYDTLFTGDDSYTLFIPSNGAF
ncbi:MAG: hypothetical protein EHM46_03500, partial [Bacteroidetes bacterium]